METNKLQKHSINHVHNLLKRYDTFEAWNIINTELNKAGIDSKVKNEIMGKFEKAIGVEKKKVLEAIEWIEALKSSL